MNETTQTGLAMAALGLAGTVAGLFFGWLKDRDKLQYDKKITDLQNQNATQATQMTTLAVMQKECEEKHKECEEQHKTTELKITEIQRQLAAKKGHADGMDQ